MENKLFKRVLSLAMVIFMVATMVPANALAVEEGEDPFVKPDPTTVTCPCAICKGSVPASGWTAYTGQTATGHYYLTADHALQRGQGSYSGKKVVINLNGFDITCTTSEGAAMGTCGHFYATGATTTLDIMDSAAHTFNGNYVSGAITGGDASAATSNPYRRGGNIGINTNATVTLHSGAITGGYAQRGGNVYVSGGKFIMYGGLITGGDSSAGYGSEVMTAGSTSRFIMYGGTITGTVTEPGVQSMYSFIDFYGGTVNQQGTGAAVRLNNTSPDYSPVTNVYGGTFNGKFETSDDAPAENTELNIYGATIRELAIDADTDISIYNGVFGNNPQNYLTSCSCLYVNDEGKYVVWAYGHKEGTCTDCKYATALTTYSDYITQQDGEHTLSTSETSSTGYACAYCAKELEAPANVNILHTYCQGCGAEQEFLPWDGISTTGHYYVEEDLELETNANIAAGNTLCLDLNGKTVTAASGKRAFVKYGALNIQDSSAEKTGLVTSANDDVRVDGDGGLIYASGGTLNIYGGTFSNGRGESGGTIYTASTTALITGDTKILNGDASVHGGNVYVTGSSKMTIDGNVLVDGGHAKSQGGNLYVTGASARLYIRNGTVSNGSNGYGGGNLGINTGGHAYMWGGTIKDGTDNNTSGAFGGGNVWVFNYSGSSMSTFVMYGGTLEGGSSTTDGNIIAARGTGRAYIYGGTILEQAAEIKAGTDPYREFSPDNGGGIFFYNVQSKHPVGTWVADCADYCYQDNTYIVWHEDVADDTCGYLTAVADPANGIVENEAIAHNYAATGTTPPTCTEEGYTTYTCVCGQSYTDDKVPALDHDYAEEWSKDDTHHWYECANDAAHKDSYAEHVFVYDKTGTGTCVCGATKTCEHTYEYTSNNDATCEADGTKHGVCSNCGNEVDVADEGTKLGHNYAEEWSKNDTHHWYECANDAQHKDRYGEHDYVKGEYTQPTTDKNGYWVVTCSVCGNSYVEEDADTMLHCAVNQQTGESYADLQAALSAASGGQTVKLLKNQTVSELFVGVDAKLDLNGFKLTVTDAMAAAFTTSHIIDSTNGEGLLVVDGADVSVNSFNEYLPIWTDEGVRFITVAFRTRTKIKDADTAVYQFYLNMHSSQTILDDILANGSDGTGLAIRIKVTYTGISGMPAEQYFEMTSDMVRQFVTVWDTKVVQLTVTGTAGRSDLAFSAEIVSTAPDGTSVVVDKVDN